MTLPAESSLISSDAHTARKALNLDAIQARVDAATAGPWFADHVDGEVHDSDGRFVAQTAPWMSANRAFIAAARTDVPALLARVAELEQQFAACDDLRQRAVDKGDKDRERVRELEQQLAAVWPCTCGHPAREHKHDSVIGRNYCDSCPGDTDLHDYEPAPSGS